MARWGRSVRRLVFSLSILRGRCGACGRITSVMPITATSSARTTRRSPRPSMRVPPKAEEIRLRRQARVSLSSAGRHSAPHWPLRQTRNIFATRSLLVHQTPVDSTVARFPDGATDSQPVFGLSGVVSQLMLASRHARLAMRKDRQRLLIFVLQLIQLPIDPTLCQVVPGGVPNSRSCAFVHHQDPVCLLDRRQPDGR